MMKRLLLWTIRGYQLALSPLLPPSCRYYPSCSEYGYQAISRYGALKGGLMAGWRVLRCNPWSIGGYDPVDASDRLAHEQALAEHQTQAAKPPAVG
jgi:hypothetical protein